MKFLEELAGDRPNNAEADEDFVGLFRSLNTWYFGANGFDVDDVMMDRLMALGINLDEVSPYSKYQKVKHQSAVAALDQVMADVVRSCRHQQSRQNLAYSSDDWNKWRNKLPTAYRETAKELEKNIMISVDVLTLQVPRDYLRAPKIKVPGARR